MRVVAVPRASFVELLGRTARRPLVFCLAFALVGCSVVDPRVMERWAKIRIAEPERDGDGLPTLPPVLPVVFIPGSQGSILKRHDCNGQVLWGNTRVVRLSALDDLLVPLPKDGVPDSERLDQKIEPCGIVGVFEVRLVFPLFVKFEYPIYQNLSEILERAGGFVRDRNVFYFSYDWRLDTRIAAVELAGDLPGFRDKYYERYLTQYCAKWRGQAPPPGAEEPFRQECLAAVARQWPDLVKPRERDPEGKYQIRFNVVSHSLGGLVARYFIQGLGYGDDVSNVALISSPSAGAMFVLKIMVAGEHALPDTLLQFYEEKETRPIGISFQSAFQGLPRYAGAVTADGDPRFQTALGLTEEMPAFDAEWEPRWESILDLADPSWNLICEKSGEGGGFSPSCRKRFFTHLRDEIESSVYFQQILNDGFCGSWGEPQDRIDRRQRYERGKVEKTKAIVTTIRRRFQGQELKVAPRGCPRVGDEPQFIQFYGHCDLTPTAAVARKEGRWRLSFCEGEAPGRDACHAFGDGRIPRVSNALLRQQVDLATDFFLCVDHVEVVKRTVVQDNLLGILFGERVDLVP